MAIHLYEFGRDIPRDGMYKIHPLLSLLSCARQIQASFSLDASLYPDLKSTSRTATTENEEIHESEDEENKPIASFSDDNKQSFIATCTPFSVPQMNPSQQKASTEFLTSSEGSITLVQGPPGTGKTTLLTATICNFLLERTKAGETQPRLMVCAPSNKAVTVLAARYIEAHQAEASPFRATLVGDTEKMMSENGSRFKDIFVYTWLPNILEELKGVCGNLTKRNIAMVQNQVEILKSKLCEVVPDPKQRMQGMFKRILQLVEQFEKIALSAAVKTLIRRLQSLEHEIQRNLLDKAKTKSFVHSQVLVHQ